MQSFQLFAELRRAEFQLELAREDLRFQRSRKGEWRDPERIEEEQKRVTSWLLEVKRLKKANK